MARTESKTTRADTQAAALRFHSVALGSLAVASYLADWRPLLWLALGLSMVSMFSVRLAVFARLHALFRSDVSLPAAHPNEQVHRFDEGMRVVLLGVGLALLQVGQHIGWLPSLAAAAISVLGGATGLSLTTVIYATLKAAVHRVPPGRELPPGTPWNRACLVCRALDCAAYPRCRWCRLESVHFCCGLQAAILLTLLMVVAFLLSASLAPPVAKLLVTLSIVGVVALGLAVDRQTDHLVTALDDQGKAMAEIAAERGRESLRCDCLRRLARAGSAEEAASTAIEHIMGSVGARRTSVMVEDHGVLRILASHGIPTDVAASTFVRVDDRICGRVFATGRAVMFRDIQSEMPDMALGLDVRGGSVSLPLVSAPMMGQNRRIGCVNVTDHPAGEFSERDIDELEFVAEATGISIAAHRAHREVDQANYDTIRALVMTVEAKDQYTHGHSMRVQAWALAIGKELGFEEQRLRMLSYAGELHDIGKLAVPDSVLNAARALTESEWALVRQHPGRGVEMVGHIGFLRLALPAIRHHHERLDGRGYPDGLSGEEIPLEARILAVVDSYDAMTSTRPYRTPFTHEVAAAELRRCVGTQFDPRCVEAFLESLGEEGEAEVAQVCREDVH